MQASDCEHQPQAGACEHRVDAVLGAGTHLCHLELLIPVVRVYQAASCYLNPLALSAHGGLNGGVAGFVEVAQFEFMN
jgi:hypothetical protein